MERGYRLNLRGDFVEGIKGPLFTNGFRTKVNQTLQMAERAKQRQKDMFESMTGSLTQFINDDGVVDGDSVLSDYFPTIEADVFISHSHNDLNMALALSQWLFEEFGLIAFVDSYIWGSGDKLIRMLDDKYCYKPERRIYDYDKRNLTTSFIHLMLASAISTTIDSCPCLMFINSPNSMSGNPGGNKTGSPWIFYELLMAKLLQRKEPETRMFAHGGILNESLEFKIEKSVPVDNLRQLSIEDLKSWQEVSDDMSPRKALDYLFKYYK